MDAERVDVVIVECLAISIEMDMAVAYGNFHRSGVDLLVEANTVRVSSIVVCCLVVSVNVFINKLRLAHLAELSSVAQRRVLLEEIFESRVATSFVVSMLQSIADADTGRVL